MVGWHSLPGFPYFNQQTTGGWIGLLIIALWLSRRHLRNIYVQAFRSGAKELEMPDRREPMSYRTALMGLILGLAFLVLFLMAGGMSFWIAFSFLILLIGMETIVTGIRAELGPPQPGLAWVGPDTILATALGTIRLGGRNLTMLTYLYFTDRVLASHPMPHQLAG